MSPPAFVPARDTRPSQEQQTASQGLHPIYDFRQGVRVLSGTAPTAWLDQDSSGDYEPEDPEPNLSDVPRRRVKKRLRRSHSMEPSSENIRNKPKTPSRKRRGRSGLGLPVASKSSKAGKDQLELCETHDSWPFDPVIPSNLHWPRSNSHTGFLTNKSRIDAPERYQLRKYWGGVHRHAGEFSTSFGDITPDHLSAGACKFCFMFGLPCSLLEHESRYPCDSCVINDEDCDPIFEPLRKQSCLSCRRRKSICSFTTEVDHRGPCKSCAASSIVCIAGPLHPRTLTKPTLGQGPSESPNLMLRPKDPATTLTERKRDMEALPPRRNTHTPGSPGSDGTQLMKLGIGANHQQEIPHKVVPTNTPHGVIHTIVTYFAHPISFNFEPTMESGPPACHWCDDLRYGLLGLGPIETEVIDYRDGRGYEEIANGHAGAGHLPSRMCTGCTLDRLMIAACIPHQVEPLPGVNTDSYVFNSFRHYLVPGMTSSAPFEWCSICPTPASYYCCKRQEPDLSSDDTTETPEARVGCGLLMCESCAGGLMAQYDGVLEHHIDALKLEGERFVMRADADFLHPKGELLRRFQQS